MECALLKKVTAKKTKKSQEFHQGIEATQIFEHTMKTLFRASKPDSKKNKKGKD
jgi:hypothetical protein